MKNLCLPLLLIILLNACSRFESSIDIEPFLLKGTDEFFYHSTTGLVLTKVMQGPQLTSVNSEGSTHYAIKFYPKSTRELFRLIRAENVLTSYYPFGYEPTNLSESEDAFVVDDFELNPYYETYTNPDNPSDEYQTRLPIIYAYWPLDGTIPDDIEHEICFFISLPSIESNREDNTREVGFIHQYPLYVRTYDDSLASYVPMSNMKVRLSYGTVWSDLYTDSNGYVIVDPILFNVTTFQESREVTVTLIYETEKWIITLGSSYTTPRHVSLGKIKDIWTYVDLGSPQSDPYFSDLSSVTKECEIHRAVDFYHNGAHQLSSYINSAEEGLIIHCMSYGSDDNSRSKLDTSAGIMAMTVFNNLGADNTQEYYIGTVLHELGHIHQFYDQGISISSFYALDHLFIESYASYVGWLLGEYYYTSKGYVKTGPDEDLCCQSRQGWLWDMSLGHDYSPFFIDLIDQYNQYMSNSTRPNDLISGVPVGEIQYMGKYCSSILGCKSYLQQLIGIYFTSSDYATQMSYY